MTILDDDIDDLLRTFRADEAVLDDDARGRMWDHICTAVPDAPAALDALVPTTGVRRLRPRAERSRTGRRLAGRRQARVLGVAAAVLALLAVAAVALRSGPDEQPVTAGPDPTEPASTVPQPADLQELADAVAGRPVTVMGSSADTRYTHQVLVRSTAPARGEPTVSTEERWIDRSGTGRLLIVGEDVAGRDETREEPGGWNLGALPADVILGLPDDVGAVLAALDAEWGIEATDEDVVLPLVETLSYSGLPGPARAGLVRALDRFGFVPVPTAGLAPNLWRVEGPGPSGSTVQVEFDLSTGGVVASTRTGPDGVRDVRTITEVDLRADTRGP